MTNTRVERTVEIVNVLGFHARPAAEFVRLAGSFGCSVWIKKDGLEVNAKSIMGVRMLAAERGTQLIVRAEGSAAEAAVDALAGRAAQGFEARPGGGGL